jgi:hypothetical protein
MIGSNCQGPKIKNNGDEAIKITEMESFVSPAQGVEAVILQPGESISADIGLVKIEALLPPGRMLVRWAGNFKPADGHSRMEKILYIHHKWDCFVDAVDQAMASAPSVDFKSGQAIPLGLTPDEYEGLKKLCRNAFETI